jgi:hypothetical protein
MLYEYFFKAVVGDGIWKQCFTENKRLGTNVSKAFAHAIIENNYFAWLYDYKSKNPGCTVLTEYDLAEQEMKIQKTMMKNRSSVVIWMKFSIALPNDGDDYELVFNEGPSKEQAKAAAEEVRKDALANVSN